MKFGVFAVVVAGLVVLVGCVPPLAANVTDVGEHGEREESNVWGEDLIVYTRCGDGVVCYRKIGTAGGLACFRDEDLVHKYCARGGFP